MFYPSCHLLVWSVITSPVLDFKGAVFLVAFQVACLMPSYMPLMLPVSEACWMLSESWSQ